MIPYQKSFLGLNLIFRIHGSPVYRATVPGIISVLIYILLELYYRPHLSPDERYIEHPYGVGVLISSVSFLIIFRANYGYQRYWNACGDVHHMMSKWLDAVTHTGVFHMQCEHFNHIKPPSYFDHHDLNRYGFKRDREKENTDLFQKPLRFQKSVRKLQSVVKSIEKVQDDDSLRNSIASDVSSINYYANAIKDPNYLVSEGRKDGGWGPLFGDDTSTFYNMKDPNTWEMSRDKGFASTVGGRTHSLFLQELTHLASLCVAVAFSTLRSDIEGTEAPLNMYKAGSPWPETDPDKLKKDKGAWIHVKDTLRYLSGFDRTPAMRAAHNASRPLPVLGGVSDNEIAFLQRAKGPSAKVTLAWHWLSEFIIREHLKGSLGKVAPPIISRLIQFLSDGMIFYNHARKTMFIPFPFPHAQISAFFVFTIIFTVPLLMDEYANDIYIGSALTFLTVTCLAGLHEVARELENPYRNVPNEIPLVTLQAMFNEALITLYSGYHPDHFWDPDQYMTYGEMKARKEGSSRAQTPKSRRNKTVKPVDKPQSVNEAKTLAQLQDLISKQQKEIERLSCIVEGSGSGNGANGKKVL